MTDGVKSKHELIAEGMGLVRSLASRIRLNIPVPVEYDDLVAFGQLGLAEAANEFDPEAGTQFTTFAYYRVRGAIYDGLSKMSWTSRARYNKLRYEQLANEALRQSQAESLGATTDSLQQDASWFRGIAGRIGVVFLATVGNEGDEGSSDSAFVDHAATPDMAVASREISEKLAALVETLPPVERNLLRNIYFEGTTLQEAADRSGLSKSWASRLHAKALEQLANLMRSWCADS